jgi:hypothetical protein
MEKASKTWPVMSWLPGTYNCKNFFSTIFLKQNKRDKKSCGKAKK